MKPIIPFLVLALAACTVRPLATLPDGTKISLGGSWASKSVSEASSATITRPDGTKITLKDMNTGRDDTSLPGAYYGYKTTVGVAGIAGHTANVEQQQGTARAANARTGTVTTTTGPLGGSTQTVTPPPTAVIPKIGKGG